MQWSSHLNNGTRWLMNMVVKVCSKSPAHESGTQVHRDTGKPGDRQCSQDDKNCRCYYYQESQNVHLAYCIFMQMIILCRKGSPYHEDPEAHTLTTVPGVTIRSLSWEYYDQVGINTKDKMLKEEKLTLWWYQYPQPLHQVKQGRRSEQLSRGSLWTPSGAGWWEL